ncbi:hypothetical protein HG535_0D03430 [Zygotorulaspora mrakii]|uniref:U3 small nucleolar RNA-associated protein 11 n=1 Tax=Zygotorulaspora mrakii TaxID=42260 RepID=A0A7H9B1V0_ZYGMR|nr:uncharacterized protein HG535_0D03430 [Zygotorulaspora mrakii]QLG72635.1 hypothetical protein HG535_0D03430 [Zygotorulaspora mrakii]
MASHRTAAIISRRIKSIVRRFNMAKLVHNVQKKQHKERSQLAGRSRLGFLEKHKDYVKRAQDYHKKEKSLKILRTKAKERNPDEYFHAMHSRSTDAQGLLHASRHGSDEDASLSTDQVKLLKTQDSNYIRTLRQMELHKMTRKSNDLTFDASGSHTVFVDTKEELGEFTPEKFFNTTVEMLNRRQNRLTKEQLTSNLGSENSFVPNPKAIMPKESLDKKRLKKLKLVKEHLEREADLKRVQQKMDFQREVMKNGSKKKITDANGNVSFKWKKQRKR